RPPRGPRAHGPGGQCDLPIGRSRPGHIGPCPCRQISTVRFKVQAKTLAENAKTAALAAPPFVSFATACAASVRGETRLVLDRRLDRRLRRLGGRLVPFDRLGRARQGARQRSEERRVGRVWWWA